MKITCAVRTLNNEDIIERFCMSYAWADCIVIADGGSSDSTVTRALEFSNTKVYTFPEKIWYPNGFYNPRGKHINFVLDLALDTSPDFICFDDSDCVPTLDLQHDARMVFEDLYKESNTEMLMMLRMFIMGQSEWFPEMTPGPGLWAWRASTNVRADESSYTISMQLPMVPQIGFNEPYALLHYFYPDEETLQKKKAQYVQTGEVLPDYNPKEQFGKLESLPKWAVWK